MKPIFEEERVFLNEKLGINLPTDCWRKSSKIYLDCTCKKPLYQFKVENGEIRITKDNVELLKDYNQKKIPELIKLYKDRLTELKNISINKTIEYLIAHQNDDLFVVSHSGGKDSTVIYDIWQRALRVLNVEQPRIYDKINDKWEVNFANTSNETADTYKYIKKHIPKQRLRILNPLIGFYQWIKDVKKYFIPSALVRNCCGTYKEGQINKHYNKDKTITMVLGMRKYESHKRAKYDYIMDYDFLSKIFKQPNIPKTWIKFCPIVEWHDEEIWLYVLKEGLEFNQQYKYGFNRCGCIICPYQHNYIDLLIQKYYPSQWKRWVGILKKNYEVTDVAKRLKWTFNEWENGKWKQGTSKEYELLQLKSTKERIKQLAEIKGISENLAERYWNRKCNCGKKLNPTEIAMFLKECGRYENLDEDNRTYLCKKCLCEYLGISKKEYQEKYINYRDEGCSLF